MIDAQLLASVEAGEVRAVYYLLLYKLVPLQYIWYWSLYTIWLIVPSIGHSTIYMVLVAHTIYGIGPSTIYGIGHYSLNGIGRIWPLYNMVLVHLHYMVFYTTLHYMVLDPLHYCIWYGPSTIYGIGPSKL